MSCVKWLPVLLILSWVTGVISPSILSAYVNLRVGFYEASGIRESPDGASTSKYVKGLLGQQYMALHGADKPERNITFVWVNDMGSIGVKTLNGTYTGILGLIHRERAEVTGLDVALEAMTQLSDRFVVSHAYKGVLGHIPMIGKEWATLISSYIAVETTVVIVTLMSIVLVSAFITWRCSSQHTVVSCFENVLKLSRCYIAQTKVEDLGRNAILALFLLGSSFFVLFYLNSVQAGMVSPDYSKVVDSVADFYRIKFLKSVMILDDTLAITIGTKEGTYFVDIWKRAKAFPGSFILRQKMAFDRIKENTVFIGNDLYCWSYLSLQCAKGVGGAWISREAYSELKYGYGIGSHVGEDATAAFIKRFMTLAEGGIGTTLKQMAQKTIQSLGGSDFCIKHSLSELGDGARGQGSVTIHYNTQALGLLVCSAIFSCTVLWIELVYKRAR